MDGEGTIADMLLTKLIMGRENQWATLYDPSRITLRASVEFANENLNLATQYTDLVMPGHVESADEIKAGQWSCVLSRPSKIVKELVTRFCSRVLTSKDCR